MWANFKSLIIRNKERIITKKNIGVSPFDFDINMFNSITRDTVLRIRIQNFIYVLEPGQKVPFPDTST